MGVSDKNEKRKEFTEEEIERVNGMSILDYARDNGFAVKKASARAYKIDGYGGLFINADGHRWNWFSQNKGGGIIQFAMEMQNLTWKEAVRQLLGRDYVSTPHAAAAAAEKGEMVLPQRNSTNQHVISYLTRHRKIDRKVVDGFIQSGMLYEDTHRNCVFVGYGSEGKERYATVRGTSTRGKPFRMDVSNSDKKYGFHRAGSNHAVNVFEAPIDMMSYISLLELHNVKGFDNHMLSLGGLSPLALRHYLKENPKIDTIMLCLDNDTAGHFACQAIREELGDRYHFIRHAPRGKDFNEDLQAMAGGIQNGRGGAENKIRGEPEVEMEME